MEGTAHPSTNKHTESTQQIDRVLSDVSWTNTISFIPTIQPSGLNSTLHSAHTVIECPDFLQLQMLNTQQKLNGIEFESAERTQSNPNVM